MSAQRNRVLSSNQQYYEQADSQYGILLRSKSSDSGLPRTVRRASSSRCGGDPSAHRSAGRRRPLVVLTEWGCGRARQQPAPRSGPPALPISRAGGLSLVRRRRRAPRTV